MSGTSFFDRLETELAGSVREGAHHDRSSVAGRHRRAMMLRRGVLIAAVAAMLAVCLVSEFPGTARGRMLPVAMARVHKSL